MSCLFCNNPIVKSSVEHIVAESLGNTTYILPAGVVCTSCNTLFSDFENKAITSSFLGFLRIKNGIKTKKGKPSTFQSGSIKGRGLYSLEKDRMEIAGLQTAENAVRNPNGSFTVTIPDFDKTHAAASKMLLKIGYEALYKSQNKIFQKFDFAELKDYLTNKTIKDWPFVRSNSKHFKFQSIPKFIDKHNLGKIKCRLEYAEVNNMLLFNFKYDLLEMTICLTSRGYSWSNAYFENDKSTAIYPMHLMPKQTIK